MRYHLFVYPSDCTAGTTDPLRWYEQSWNTVEEAELFLKERAQHWEHYTDAEPEGYEALLLEDAQGQLIAAESWQGRSHSSGKVYWERTTAKT